MLKKIKKSKKSQNYKKHDLKRLCNKAALGLLNLSLTSFRQSALQKGYHKTLQINNIFTKTRRNMKLIIKRERWPLRSVYLTTVNWWLRKVNKSRFFYKLKPLNSKQIIKKLKNREKIKYITSVIGPGLAKKNFHSIRVRSLYKHWLILLRTIIFVNLYLKNVSENTVGQNKNKNFKKIKSFIRRSALKNITFRSIYTKNYYTCGSYANFNNFSLEISCANRYGKIPGNYLSSFLQNGKPVGSSFGLYLGLHYYINHYVKRRFRHLPKKFTSVLQHDLNDFNIDLSQNCSILTRLNDITNEVQSFRHNELWYHKNYLRQNRCYLRNGGRSGFMKGPHFVVKSNVYDNTPFTMFGRIYPISAFTDKAVSEGLYASISK